MGTQPMELAVDQVIAGDDTPQALDPREGVAGIGPGLVRTGTGDPPRRQSVQPRFRMTDIGRVPIATGWSTMTSTVRILLAGVPRWRGVRPCRRPGRRRRCR